MLMESKFSVWVISNKILIQWGRATHPKVSANASSANDVNLPTSFTQTNYSVAIAMIIDAGYTFYLRQYQMTKYKSKTSYYWYSKDVTTLNTGQFQWIAIGY